MVGNGIFTLLAVAAWLYGLFLALTRTKSLTAKAVVALSLLGLFLGTGVVTVRAECAEDRGYPYTREAERALPAIHALELALTNAEVIVHPGNGRLTLTYKARHRAALARMRPEVRLAGDRLILRDDRQPRGTVYRVELTLPRPVVAKIAFTNGELRAKDRLSALDFSATNGVVRLRDYRPTGTTRISCTNGKVELRAFAPQGPTRMELMNGAVRVLAARPLKVHARITNGTIRLPGTRRAAAGGAEVTYGPDQAPPILVRILNGELDYREVNP